MEFRPGYIQQAALATITDRWPDTAALTSIERHYDQPSAV